MEKNMEHETGTGFIYLGIQIPHGVHGLNILSPRIPTHEVLRVMQGFWDPLCLQSM